MNTYQRYQQARDAAWKTLIACKISSLPIDTKAIAGCLNIAIHPFPEENADLSPWIRKMGDSPCHALRIKGKWHIYLREGAMDDQHVHFAIAHEIGHIILHHDTQLLAPGIRAFSSHENEGDIIDDPLDIADYIADIFAVRLLSPACVLHAMKIYSPHQIVQACFLPPKAAKIRAERMELLMERNLFLSHPLERQVYNQFLPGVRKEYTPGLPRLSIPPPDQASSSPARQQLIAALPPPKSLPPHSAGKKCRWPFYVLGALLFAAAILAYIFLR